MISIVPIYAAILALYYIRLTFNTIDQRRSNKVSRGNGGNEDLDKAIRAHGNFIEFTPIALLLLFFIETKTLGYTGTAGLVWAVSIHAWCLILLVGRYLHAVGMTAEGKGSFRVRGMVSTIGVIVSSALSLFVLSIWQLF